MDWYKGNLYFHYGVQYTRQVIWDLLSHKSLNELSDTFLVYFSPFVTVYPSLFLSLVHVRHTLSLENNTIEFSQ